MCLTTSSRPACLHCRERESRQGYRGLCYVCYIVPGVREGYPKQRGTTSFKHLTLCRHCNRGKRCRPRGLCWSCYYTPGVRNKYSKGSRTSSVGRTGAVRMPQPTTALPGSPEKVRVIEERARLGMRLWHPLDAVLDRRAAEAPEEEEQSS